jgi:hypothetical protein
MALFIVHVTHFLLERKSSTIHTHYMAFKMLDALRTFGTD